MKYLTVNLLVVICSCSQLIEHTGITYPTKIVSLDDGIAVEHSLDTVYATLNTKDPEKRGKYQLQFETMVSSLSEKVRIEEFGAYILIDNEWTPASIYNRPFNNTEFAKWYNCEGGMLEEGKTYSDKNNWLRKTNTLTNDTLVSLWYYIGINEEGKKVVGAKEIVGIVREK